MPACRPSACSADRGNGCFGAAPQDAFSVPASRNLIAQLEPDQSEARLREMHIHPPDCVHLSGQDPLGGRGAHRQTSALVLRIVARLNADVAADHGIGAVAGGDVARGGRCSDL